MNLNSLLKKCANYFSKVNNDIFSCSYADQKQYLDRFKNPKDEIERSFFQYCCQMHLYPFCFRVLFNIASFPLLILHIAKKKNDNGYNETTRCVAAFIECGLPHNIIPHAIFDKYKSVIFVSDKKEFFTKKDWQFIKTIIRRYPFSWLFLLKCVIKIKMYSHIIKENNPSAIITCNEYSFTSSILTKYCNKQNIKHIDVMHGEKLFFIRDSFFKYDECYVWDEFYIELFKKLRADDNQFIIAVPKSLEFDDIEKNQKVYDYTFYLAAETGDRLKNIAKALNQIKEKGYLVSVRPHPRYSNESEVRQVFSDFNIEPFTEISIEESLMNTKNAISGYSTVLNQAYRNGIGIVIDDVSDVEAFNKLKEYQYIMLNKPHSILSKVCDEIVPKEFLDA